MSEQKQQEEEDQEEEEVGDVELFSCLPSTVMRQGWSESLH